MGAALAARMGDEVGGHGEGWLGLALGALAGVAIGALIVAGTIATGGLLAIAVGALVAAGTVTGLASVGAKIGKRHLSGASCGKVTGGASRTFIEGKAVARANDDPTSHNQQKVAQGSSTVNVEKAPLAREGDKVKCGGKILHGCERTFIGGDPTPTPPVDDGPSAGMLDVLDKVSEGCLIGAALLTLGGAMAGAASLAAGAAAGARAALPILGWVGGARVAHWAVEKVGGEEAALWADGLMIAAGGVHGAIEGGGGAEGRGAPEVGAEEPEVLAPDEPPVKDDAAEDDAPEKEEEPEPITARDPPVGEDDAAAAPAATPEPTCATCDAAPPPPDDPAAAARKAIEDGTVWDRPSLKGVSQEEIDLAGRKGNSQDQIRARKKLAKRFYKQKAGMTAAEARNHMRGIDFDEPVTMGPPPAAPGTQVQYQVPGGRQGQYYADPDATPSQLGIHDQGATMGPDGWGTGPVAGKTPVTYDVDPSTQYMQSTAAPVKDTWSVPGHSYGTEGGATQRFIPSGSDGVSPSGGGQGN